MKGFLKLIQKQKNSFYFPFAILGITVFVFCVCLDIFLFYSFKQTFTLYLRPNFPKIIYYPKFNKKVSIDVFSQSYLVADVTTQKIIVSKNLNLHFSPASTTKIMTALVSLNYFKINQILTIKSSNITPVVAGFIPGQKITFENLLYAMLLPSANDAAVAIADNYPGGSKTFVKAMNMKANALHLYDTHFSDPVGLNDDSDFTTPLDLFRLSSEAIKNSTFRKIISTKEKIIYTVDKSTSFDLINLNELLGWKGVFGIKTGYTQDAGQVLVTSLNKDGHIIIIIVMYSKDRFLDTKTLINDVVDNTNYLPIDL